MMQADRRVLSVRLCIWFDSGVGGSFENRLGFWKVPLIHLGGSVISQGKSYREKRVLNSPETKNGAPNSARYLSILDIDTQNTG